MKTSILVVDDDADMAWAIGDILSDAGYGVVTASDGHDAFQKLRAAPTPPAMILLDVMMPGMDGRQFLAQLSGHESLSRIPVVVTTAGRIDAQDLRARGAAGFLRKPFDSSALLELARSLSARARPDRSTDARIEASTDP